MTGNHVALATLVQEVTWVDLLKSYIYCSVEYVTSLLYSSLCGGLQESHTRPNEPV